MTIDAGKISARIPSSLPTESPSRIETKVPEPAAAGDDDAVHLTDTASQLRQAEKSLESVPAVDAGRVAEIRLAIERGDYPIDPERLAAKFLELEKEISQP